MNIFKKFRNSLKTYSLVGKNDKIVIGVSGGPDSLCLLLLLNSLKKELNLSLCVAHLDHMMRQDSHKDALFVKELSAKLKLPVVAKKCKIRKINNKGSLEEIARNKRLKFLYNTAISFGAKKIALAHNFDDQAETVLMRILRGTGLQGLSGMLPKREMGKICIIRPLLSVSRAEIEKFLKLKKVKFVLDSSNSEDIYFRNKIRHKLLPLLEKEYNQNIREVLVNLGESSGYDYDYLENQARRALRLSRKGLNLIRLKKLHPAILRLKIREAIADIQGSTRRISFIHIREITDLILNRPLNSVVDLPKGISVKKKPKTLIFYRR